MSRSAGLRIAVPLTGRITERSETGQRFQWFHRKASVPYWIMAVTLASTLAGTTALGLAVQNHHRPLVGSHMASAAAMSAPAAFTVASAAIVADSTLGTDLSHLSPQQQAVSLHGELQQLSTDLERAQRDNAQMRNEARQQSGDLASTQADYAAADEWRKANGSELDDLQGNFSGLQGQLSSELGTVQERLAALERAVQSAEKQANELRGLLGLPQAAAGSSGMGGNPLPDGTQESDPIAKAEIQILTLKARVEALDANLSTLTANASIPGT